MLFIPSAFDDFSGLVCGRWLILKHDYMCYHLMQSLGGYFKLGSHWAGNSNIQKLVFDHWGSKRQGDSPFSSVTHFVTPVTLSRTLLFGKNLAN